MPTICLDYIDNQMIGWIKGMDGRILSTKGVYKIKIQLYVASLEAEKIIFKKTDYLKLRKIINSMKEASQKIGCSIEVTDTLRNFIEQKEFYIESKYAVGKDIKKRHKNVTEHFQQFREVVSAKMSRQLREKQMWDAFFMTSMEKSSNFSVPGSGKTSSVLGMYAYLKSKGLVNRIVVIAPKNAFGSWMDEFNACFDGIEDLRLFNIHDKKYKNKAAKKRALLYDTGSVNLFLFNYEGVKDYVEIIQNIVSECCLLVYDEVHKVKAIGGALATHALAISERAKYVVAMTGTPLPNSYTDIYNLLNILYADEYDNFFKFRHNMLKNPLPADIALINEKIYPFFCRTNKTELNVPKPNPDLINRIEASEAENRLFHILYQKYKGNKFSMLIRILQLESDPKMLLKELDLSEFKKILDDSGDSANEIDFVDYSYEVEKLIKSIKQTTKTRACIEEVSRLVDENKTVIVWCIFVDTMSNLKKLLDERGICTTIIKGEVELEERLRIVDSFKNGDIQVLITNPHTLAESVSLHQVCHDAVYFEYSYNLVHLLQSKDRIHRLGLAENQYTQYHYMMSEFVYNGDIYSLDEQIFNRLVEKEQTMLDAIDQNILEHGTSRQEDLDLIFGKLFAKKIK